MELPVKLGKYLQRLGFTYPVNWNIQLTEGEAKITISYANKDSSWFLDPQAVVPYERGSPLAVIHVWAEISYRIQREEKRPENPAPTKLKRKSPSMQKRDSKRLQAFLEQKKEVKVTSGSTPSLSHNPEPPVIQTASSLNGEEQEKEQRLGTVRWLRLVLWVLGLPPSVNINRMRFVNRLMM